MLPIALKCLPWNNIVIMNCYAAKEKNSILITDVLASCGFF
jgi:hypothetical protein